MVRKSMRIYGRAELDARGAPRRGGDESSAGRPRRRNRRVMIVGVLIAAIVAVLVTAAVRELLEPEVTSARIEPALTATPAPEPVSAVTPAPKQASPRPQPKGTLYAIVVTSIPEKSGESAAAARREADAKVTRLRSIGFRNARWERVSVSGQAYLRVIAAENRYPSAKNARADIQAMIRRGEIESGFPVAMEGES